MSSEPAESEFGTPVLTTGMAFIPNVGEGGGKKVSVCVYCDLGTQDPGRGVLCTCQGTAAEDWSRN